VGTVVQRLLAEHLFDNVPERNALEKAGFRRDGVIRGAQVRGGQRRDMPLYGMLRTGVKYKDLTPEQLREAIYARNRVKYGDPLGPTIDYLRNKGKSWEDIIESAARTGGRDLGF
jgi:hypothetical protein